MLRLHAADSIQIYLSQILKFYTIPNFTDDEKISIVKMLSNDKKNKGGTILCCLLEEIGNCKYDCAIDVQEFETVFSHFQQFEY